MSANHGQFFTILLTDKFLQSALVSNNGQGLQIKEFSTIQTYFDRQDLIEQLDKSLQELGPDSQDIAEAVLVLDRDWLTVEGELSDQKKPVLKQAAESLTLQMVGQLSIPVAMAEARLIGDEKDSCLLLLFKEQSLELLLIDQGELLDLVQVGRSASITDDVAEALARCAKQFQSSERQHFPSKVLLTSLALSAKELAGLKHQLEQVDWTSNPGFAQPPTLVVLETDYMIKSASLSAGKVINQDKLLVKLPATAAPVMPPTPVASPTAAVSPSADSTPEFAVEPTQASSFGISFDHQKIGRPAGQLIDQTPTAVAGFAESSDSARTQSVAPDPTAEATSSSFQARSPWRRFYLAHQRIILLGVAAGLLGLLVLAGVFAWFFARVTVQVQPEVSLLQKSVNIVLDPKLATSNFEQALLQASLDNQTIAGQDVLPTTGIGLVGEKASGKVLIYNKTNTETTLKAGTVLSSDGIEFLLDEEVKVPEAVEKQGGSGVDYGKVEGKVTAKDIGAEANLNKETKLRVADYFDDKFSAVSADNFSGGSSREVRVVAEADQQKLRESLEQKLIAEARAELEAATKDGTYLVPTGVSKVIESDFSAEVGTETDSLTLSLTLEVEAVKYLSADLKKLGLALLEKELPPGYVLLDEDPSLLSDKAQVASGSSRINLNAELSAKAIAQLDLEELKTQVAGKSWLEVEETLAAHSDIKSAAVVFHPPFLMRVMRQLPSDPSRITVELAD